MGGTNEVQLYATCESAAKRALFLVTEEVKRIEAKYSRFRETSIVSQIAAASGAASVKVDPETARLITFAKNCFVQSGGLFDITSGALQRTWNFNSQDIPSPDAISEAKALVGFERVRWQDPWIELPTEGMALDFGGLAKEYAVDRACDILRASGIEHALINFAGDVAAVGPKADGTPWQVGIAHPREKTTFDVVGLYRGALATSGDYERFKIVDGIRYCHILNPLTGYPVEGVHSVSVLAESCLVAGALSTIGMLLGWETGQHRLQHCGAPSLFIRENEYVAKGWPGVMTQPGVTAQTIRQKPVEVMVG